MMPGVVVKVAPHLPALLLTLALTIAGVVGCGDAGDHAGDAGPHGRGVYVAATWRLARSQPGHEVHVVTEKIKCVKCHTLEDTAVGDVDPRRCGECHEKEATLVHAREQAEKRLGPGVTTDCTTCHAFKVDDPLADAGAHPVDPKDCARCHLKQRQGDTPAVRVHGTRECVTCHEPHASGPPKSAPCTECHGEVRTLHASKGKDATGICTTCHKHQHATADEARGGCVKCHAENEARVPESALFAGGHKRCTGCHRPHDFDKSRTAPCRDCHADTAVLGGGRIAAHNQCTSCHKPHDVLGGPDTVCGGCHTDKFPDHPRDKTGKQEKAGRCVGCHDPHTPAGHNRAKPCSTCHQSVANDTGFHNGTPCRKCHVPHDFVRPTSDHSACRACHSKQLAAVLPNPGHQACEKCHEGLPHRPTKLRAGCDSCHGAIKKTVVAGHADCAKCHEPHSGTRVAECKSCHQKQHASAPAAHKDCTKCHQPHTGTPTQATCGSCHGTQAASAHGKVTRGCVTCHQAHGPATVQRPTCSSCHAATTLSGLHRVEPHRDCADCHDGHSRVSKAGARSACLTCHAGMRNHQPQADVCTGCHLFR